MSMQNLQLHLGWAEQFALRGRWAGARDSLERAAEALDQMEAAESGMSRDEILEPGPPEIFDEPTEQQIADLVNERR